MFSLERTTGWSMASSAMAHVARLDSRDQIERALEEARRRGLTVIPRGAGYSYGDEILNDGGIILDLSRMDQILEWDPESGRMTVEPGVTFEKALSCCLRDNWVVPAVPGTRYPTLGGSLSNNVHGKNGWKDGTIGDWAVQFTLLAGDGQVYRCSREENPELFYSAIGGVGLFGIFLEITLQFKRIPSPYVGVRKWTVPDLGAMLRDFEELRETADYHIGWVDCFTKGNSFGRGTIHAASFVEAPVRARQHGAELGYRSPFLFGFFPRKWVWPIIKPFFGNSLMRTVNWAKFHSDRLTANDQIDTQNYFEFTFLLDQIPNWRELFLPHGYLELEPIIPFETCEDAFRTLIELTQQYGTPSHLTAIKSHKEDDFLLSHSLDGCSIGIDLPVVPGRMDELNQLFSRMNEVVMKAGGRIYLAKDEKLTSEYFQTMYPSWKKFDSLKRKYDPELLFQSDMYRRLFPVDNT
jgi:decaprenylphospho-beta-D-ribofuranose 2-oxidase